MIGIGAFDLQVNGYAGVDFNADELEPEDLARVCARLREDGVDQILATVVTAAPRQMLARVARIAELCARDAAAARTIAGIHVEGPFLSAVPGFVGAHPAEHTRDADPGLLTALLDAGAGRVRLVTLAPERDPKLTLVSTCRGRGVTVAAGHTDASLAMLERAIDAGLSLFTHLGNGCPQLLPRHDNIVQRALSLADRMSCCFIADGAHIPFFALRNYLRIASIERSIIVTDAISAAGLGPGRFPFAGQTVTIGEDLVPRPAQGDHLVGSATTMPRAIENLRTHCGLDLADLRRICRDNPRRALGLPTLGDAP